MKTVQIKGAEIPRSPRIFAKRLRRPAESVRAGEEVTVRAEDGTFVGRGFYSPHSVFGVRIYDRHEKGPPLDAEWLAGRVRAALALRREVLPTADSEGDELEFRGSSVTITRPRGEQLAVCDLVLSAAPGCSPACYRRCGADARA